MSEKDPKIVAYKPSVFYFREALRETSDPAELRKIGFLLCAAYEEEREWIRAQGLIPPKRVILESEARDKGWDGEQITAEDPNQIRFPFE